MILAHYADLRGGLPGNPLFRAVPRSDPLRLGALPGGHRRVQVPSDLVDGELCLLHRVTVAHRHEVLRELRSDLYSP